MFVLCVDLETTGLDPSVDSIIEIGAILWDTSRNIPVKVLSEIINPEEMSIPLGIIELTGISNNDISLFGIPLSDGLDKLNEFATHADALVGHNIISFDKQFLNRAEKNLKKQIKRIPIIDTAYDIPFEKNIKAKKLTYLAAEHGFLNPFAHRAVFDALTTMKILSNYSLKNALEYARTPLIEIAAQVTFAEKQKAQSLGFYWDAQSKSWKKKMRQKYFDESNFPFDCEVIETIYDP